MFSKTAELDMMAHALDEFPRESCGFVVDGIYKPCINTSSDPAVEFEIGPQDYLHTGGIIQAVIHSHPSGWAYPSKDDMQGQIDSDLAWGIVNINKSREAENPFYWGGNTPIPELLRRGFRHGVTDCYSLIKDWYKLHRDIDLPEFPRGWDWWAARDVNGKVKPVENMYVEGFRKAGFAEISICGDPKVGDIAMLALGADVINHAGVYIGHGLVMHHPGRGRRPKGYDPQSLSKQEPLSPLMQEIQKWVRRIK